MPLSPAFRKDIGDIKTKVLDERDYSAAVTLIESLLAAYNQNPTRYTLKEVDTLRHALAHLKAMVTDDVVYPETLTRLRDRILDRDPETT